MSFGDNGGRLCPQGIETRVNLHNEIANREAADNQNKQELQRLETTVSNNCDRISEVEDTVTALSYRIGTWAAIGMIVGGVAIQAFTRYVLGW